MRGSLARARTLVASAVLAALVAPTAAAQVRVMNAQGDSLVIRCPVEDCRPRLWLLQPDSAPTLIRVRVDSLQRPDFTMLPVRWSIVGREEGVDTVTLSPGGGVNVALHAALSERGRYEAAVNVTYDKKSTYTRIVLMRGQGSPSIEVVGPAPVAATTGTVQLWFQARDSVGHARSIESVTFDSLTRSWSGKRVQAQYTALGFGADNKCANHDSTALNVKADGALQVFLCIEGVHDPGEYAGLLRIKPSGAPALTRPVTFLVRWHWYWALLAIAFGVGLSAGLRWYTENTRPRLQRLVQLQNSQARLEGVRASLTNDDEAIDAVVALRARLADLSDAVDRDPMTNIDASIATLNRRIALLGAWLKARTFVAGIEPVELRTEFEPMLQAAHQAAFGENTTTDQFATAENGLVALPDAVRTRVRTWRRDQATQFAKQVTDELAQVTDPAVRSELQQVLQDVGAAIKSIDAGAGPQADTQLREARLGYVRAIAREHASAIDPTRPPLGFNPNEWPATADSMLQELKSIIATDDPDDAAHRFQRLYARHLDQRAKALRDEVDDQKTLIAANNQLKDDEKKTYTTALDESLKQLPAAQESAVAGRLREAATTIAAVEQAIVKTIVGIPAPGQAQGGARQTVAPSAGETVPARGTIPVLASVAGSLLVPHLGPPGSAQRWLARGQWLVLGAAGLVAILVGFNQLYADSPTWGGAKDVFTAILWGLGITQTTGATFDLVMNSMRGKTSA